MFSSVKASRGEVMTNGTMVDLLHNAKVHDICVSIAHESDHDKIGELKKQLPIITWQASFPGRRVANEAVPSGLFMLDIDDIDNPFEMWNGICRRTEELGIVVAHATPSRRGLRLVAKCRKEFKTIAECQQWLAEQLHLEKFDAVCKDWARASYAVPADYVFYMNGQALWVDEPAEGTVYSTCSPAVDNVEMNEALFNNNFDHQTESEKPNTAAKVDQREGLFGGSDTYKGIPYSRICEEWLLETGGNPERGERNVRLHRLATRLRYITDFNAATMLRVMPRFGLDEEEMKIIIASSLKGNKGSDMPLDLKMVLDNIDRQIKLEGDEENLEPEVDINTNKMPSLPPLLRQWCDVAPDDFKRAVVLCQLPILGALGSRLRAKYLDGNMHSPSFQVSLEAPQASGKSFMVKLVNYELKAMMQSDEASRAKEREYRETINKLKVTNSKLKKEDLPEKPKVIIRYLPPTISITMLLKRMEEAQGLHCFALAEEIDTVTRAFKRGFSNLSEVLRVSFDNGLYGQDYASENSWSGNVPLFYNTLFSGTPKAMRRFYPDVEDGLVSRVLFVTLPDQFGKPMPVWRPFTETEQLACDTALERLNEVTLQGDEVMPEHVMRLNFVNDALAKWITSKQVEAVRTKNRTIDTFCRRAAVVGFRAAMLAFFLWGEKNTPAIRRNTTAFALWVANEMLVQHLLRFDIENSSSSNVNRYNKVYEKLADVFTRQDLVLVLQNLNKDTSFSEVIYRWKLLGIVEESDKSVSQKDKNKQYKKIKK